MGTHANLLAFQVGYEFGLAVIRSTERWPKREMFGLSAQARRASTSISINIAEGVAKRGRRELRRYLDISLGSLAEVEVIISFARDLNFVSAVEAQELEHLRTRAAQLTWRLYESTRDGRGRPDPSR